MGKEGDLLKAIRDKDATKVQRLLSTTVKRTKDESLCWKSGESDSKIRVELRHIDVNTREPETEYTPLLLSVLLGSKDIAERLIFNCADVNLKDVKGNTALHLAVFNGRDDMVDMLLFNDIQVNIQNGDGNTALHLACETFNDKSSKIIKSLIKNGSSVWTENKFGHTPLDVAAMYNRKDAIVNLLAYLPTLKENKTALIEASIRGFKDVVEVLLDYGCNCNALDERHCTSALIEAVRYHRYEVIKVLLSFGAKVDVVNLKKESPTSLIESLSSEKKEKIQQFFDDQKEKSPRVPMMAKTYAKPLTPELKSKLVHIKDYPLLPTDINWSQNRPLYCSTCTEKNPNTHILDGNLKTFWVLPVLHNGWTVLDLHSDHVISGITVYGWNSPQMLKTFQIQSSNSIEGPWTTVTSLTCELLGSSDPKQSAFPQTFRGFTFRDRYIRLYLVDNHGGSYICFQGIELYGADCQVIDTLHDCGLQKVTDDFILRDINTWQSLMDVSQELVDELVRDPEKKASLWEVIYRGRRDLYPMTMLMWLKPPESAGFTGEDLPDFSVQSDSGVTELIELIVQGGEVKGNRSKRLNPLGPGKPSVATFTNISISNAGLFTFLVKGVNTELTLVAPKQTEIRPLIRNESDISSAFDEIQQMLSEVQASFTTP